MQRYQHQRAPFLLLGLIAALVCNVVWASETLPPTAIGEAFAQDANEVSKVNNNTVARNLQTYSPNEFQSLLLAAVNKERAAVGLPSLCMSRKLQSSAQKHSDDMAAKNYMSHTGSDRSSMSQRITASGFVSTAIAENVAAGQKDVTAVMKSWMNSAGHKKNILSSNYKMFGCGYAYNSKSTYKHYWTQDFGASSTESCSASSSSSSEGSSTTAPPATQKPTIVLLATKEPTTAPPTSQTGTMQTQMLAAVNKQRAAVGLPALCMNSKLQSAAQGHSKDMGTNNFMSHTGSNGSTISQRITAAGYVWKSIAENVAAGQTDVDAVMTAWMNSPGHKANILSSKVTMFGCAYSYNAGSTYKHYWTQDFGRGSSESCSS